MPDPQGARSHRRNHNSTCKTPQFRRPADVIAGFHAVKSMRRGDCHGLRIGSSHTPFPPQPFACVVGGCQRPGSGHVHVRKPRRRLPAERPSRHPESRRAKHPCRPPDHRKHCEPIPRPVGSSPCRKRPESAAPREGAPSPYSSPFRLLRRYGSRRPRPLEAWMARACSRRPRQRTVGQIDYLICM